MSTIGSLAGGLVSFAALIVGGAMAVAGFGIEIMTNPDSGWPYAAAGALYFVCAGFERIARAIEGKT